MVGVLGLGTVRFLLVLVVVFDVVVDVLVVLVRFLHELQAAILANEGLSRLLTVQRVVDLRMTSSDLAALAVTGSLRSSGRCRPRPR